MVPPKGTPLSPSYDTNDYNGINDVKRAKENKWSRKIP